MTATAELTRTEPAFDLPPLKFEVSQQQIAELRAEYMALTITDVNDKDQLAAVRAGRSVCRKLRVGVEKYAKTARDGYNRAAKAVIAAERSITEPIGEIEAHLEAEEGKVKREQERIMRELEEKRIAMVRERLRLLALVTSNSPKTFDGDVDVIAVYKGRDRYVFIYTPETVPLLFESFGRLLDSDCNIMPSDVRALKASVREKLRKQSEAWP